MGLRNSLGVIRKEGAAHNSCKLKPTDCGAKALGGISTTKQKLVWY